MQNRILGKHGLSIHRGWLGSIALACPQRIEFPRKGGAHFESPRWWRTSTFDPSHANACSRRRSSRGFTLIECLVAGAMLLVVMAMAAQLFSWDARERREAWRRQVAQQEAANVLERLSIESPESLSQERFERLALSPESAAWLPEGDLGVSATEFASPRPGKRIRIEITWRQTNGNPAPPVRLTGWAFSLGESP